MKMVIWSKDDCIHCRNAKSVGESLGIEVEVRTIGIDVTKEDLLLVVPDAKTVPQIFLDDKYIGGLNELMILLGGRV